MTTINDRLERIRHDLILIVAGLSHLHTEDDSGEFSRVDMFMALDAAARRAVEETNWLTVLPRGVLDTAAPAS